MAQLYKSNRFMGPPGIAFELMKQYSEAAPSLMRGLFAEAEGIMK